MLHNPQSLILHQCSTIKINKTLHTLTHTHFSNVKPTNLYCFTADPTLTHWSNKILTLLHQPAKKYFSNISNSTFHNVCKQHTPPPGAQQLLGLGPKFIPQYTHPWPQLSHTIKNFIRDVRLKFTFTGSTPNIL